MKNTKSVSEYMAELEHPLKEEINAVRNIINSNTKIAERIKWNAPSYFYKADLVTFNPRNQNKVHLVFHHIAITKNTSKLLEGDYKDRRMLYFSSMKEILSKEKQLTQIIDDLVQEIDKL